MTKHQCSMIDKALDILKEHFEAVQIHASFVGDDKHTHISHQGFGNWYSRQGMCHEFIQTEQADQNARSMEGVLSQLNDDDDYDPGGDLYGL